MKPALTSLQAARAVQAAPAAPVATPQAAAVAEQPAAQAAALQEAPARAVKVQTLQQLAFALELQLGRWPLMIMMTTMRMMMLQMTAKITIAAVATMHAAATRSLRYPRPQHCHRACSCGRPSARLQPQWQCRGRH